ncbi:MAG: acetyl-CoA carboxylase biotin carboxyl carrier protein subunit, partial [Bacteroidales bacterium]|nr:acetyl-CoA carboxylase biotin carboxyl carrier protein subunit [Bacteroidales bacterium]
MMTKNQKNIITPRFNSLLIEGTRYKTYFTKKYKNRIKWEKPNDKKYYSSIPGTILKVNIKEGDKVSAGDQMFILESMKMKNKILLEKTGIVKKIYA